MLKKIKDILLSDNLKQVGNYINSFFQLIRSHNPRRHSPERRSRKRLRASIALAIILTIFSLSAYNLADKRFSHHLSVALERITGGEVEVGAAELNILSDIRIRDLDVYLPGKPHDQRYLVFSSDDILLEYNPWSIFSHEMEVDRIVSIGALLNLSYEKDEKSWNLAKLKLKRTEGGRKTSFPKVVFRDSHIQYQEAQGDSLSPPLRQQFSGEIVRDNVENLISFNFNSDKDTALPNCKINGSFDPESSELSAELRFDMEKFTSGNLPPNLERFKNLYDTINPRGQLAIHSLYSPAKGNRLSVTLDKASAGIDWMGTGAILPLNNVTGEIVVTGQQTEIKSIQVDYVDGSINLSGYVSGYSKDSEINLKIASSGLNLPKDQWDNFDILESNLQDIEKLKSYSLDARSTGSVKSVLKMLICAMPPNNKKILWETIPTGALDIEVSFARKDGNNVVAGDIQLVNTSGRHIRFPYHVDGAHGPIHFEPGRVWFGPIEISENDQHVLVNGKADKNQDDNWVIDVDVDVKNITVSNALYSAFNKLQRDVFDMFNPTGKADAFYTIHVIQGQEPQDSLDLTLKDCSGTFKFFPVPAKECYGKVRWQRDKTTFTIEQAKVAGGTLKAAGYIDTVKNQDSVIDCNIDFANVVLDETVAGQLPSMIKEQYDKAKPLGELSGTVNIKKIFDGHISETPIDNIKADSIQHELAMHLTNGSVYLDQFPRLIENVDTSVRIKDLALQIDNFSGQIKWPKVDSSVSAAGTIDKKQYDLKLSCKQLPLSQDVRELALKSIPDVINNYKPSGIFDIDLSAKKETDQPLNYSAVVTPHDMQAVFMDYIINDLNGKIVAVPGLVTLDDLSVNYNAVVVNGTLANKSDFRKYDLRVAANNVAIDANLKNAFADEIPLLNDDIGLTGVLSCDANLALETNEPNTNMIWNVNGTGAIKNGYAKLPLETTEINSKADYSIQFDQVNNQIELELTARDANAFILKRPINNTSADITYASKDGILNVDIINSQFCRGRLDGNIESNLAKSDKPSKIELMMKNCNLRDFVVAKESDTIKGQLKGYINLFHTSETAFGKFEFSISDGALGRLPLIAGILNIINLSLPHEGAFQDAAIVGDIVDSKTVFTKMDFYGSAISINGKGQMEGPFSDDDKNGELDITFLIEAPQIIKPIPVLGSLFNAVRSGFIHVRATGKYDKPSITPVPLSLIGDLFKDYKSSK